jgi:hypothetical protein
MATNAYLNGRKRYSRPQAILWANTPGTLSDGLYVPSGQEIGADPTLTTGGVEQFLILSDHNRSEMAFTPERIEKRQRTINGRMRSYHIADKMKFSTSWNNLPSRSYYQTPLFDDAGESPYKNIANQEYTSDGGAGGVELLDWYEKHTGSFWMFLSYDKHNNFEPTEIDTEAPYKHLNQYNEVIEVYITDFNYSVVKRGGQNHDLWNVSVSLEEV